jgi:RNA polymerase sigma-70 factor (ECF subfamily)
MRVGEDLGEAYESFFGLVYATCLKRLGQPADAEDAAQEVFLRAAPHLMRIRGSVLGYLLVTAQRVCTDRQRAERRAHRLVGVISRESRIVDATEVAVDAADIAAALGSLTAEEQSLLALVHDGYSYDEVGSRLGRTVPAVRNMLTRTRHKARLAVGRGTPLSAGAMLVAWWRRRLGRRVTSAPSMAMTATLSVALLSPFLFGGGVGSIPPLTIDDPHSAPRAGGPGVAAVQPAAASRSGGAVATAAVAAPHPPASAQGSVIDRLTGRDAPQSSVQFEEITASQPSPNQTVFAWGTAVQGCQCPVLYSSSDSGRSWQRLDRAGYLGGRVLIPDGYPSNPTLFAIGSYGLQRSDDGGQLWALIAPAAVSATLLHGRQPGHTTVLVLEQQALLVYHEDSGLMTPAATLPPLGVGGPQVLPMLELADDDTAVVLEPSVGVQQSQASGTTVVIRCSLSAATCVHDGTIPGSLSLSHSSTPGSALFAKDIDHVYRWDPRAGLVLYHSFSEARDGLVLAVGTPANGSGSPLIGTWAPTVAPDETFLWQAIGQGGAGSPRSLPFTGMQSIVTLADGDILTAVAHGDSAAPFGVRCSHDGGQTWSLTCP